MDHRETAPPKKKTRKPAVAAPGATRLSLTGIMAVPDDFGRIRVLLVDRLSTGAGDYSYAALRREIPAGPGFAAPYVTREPDSEGTRGEFHAVPPARHKAHWLKVAEELRGREVRVEVTVRRYSFDTLARHGAGASLDVAMIEPFAAPAPAAAAEPGRGTDI